MTTFSSLLTLMSHECFDFYMVVKLRPLISDFIQAKALVGMLFML